MFLEKQPPALLILDLPMPTIDGRTFGRVIKRRLPVPIVIYSSEIEPEITKAVGHVGAAAGVSKSAPDKALVHTVLGLLVRERYPYVGRPTVAGPVPRSGASL